MLVLVLDLRANDGAAILVKQPLNLLPDLGKQYLRVPQILLVITSQIERSAKQPIGEAAVAHLAVAKRPDTQDNEHMMFPAELNKFVQVLITAPVEPALDLLVMNPDNIGGDDIQTAHLHLDDLILPCIFVHSGEMSFTADCIKGFPIHLHKVVVEAQHVSSAVYALHIQRGRINRFFYIFRFYRIFTHLIRNPPHSHRFVH